MKKTIIIVVILGMFGYAVYDLVFQADDTTSPDTKKETEHEEISSVSNQENETAGDEKSDTTVEATVGLNVGNIAPDFQLQTLKGEEVKLSDYRG